MKLSEIMDKYNYNESLRKTLEDVYQYILDADNDILNTQFLKCLERTEIILTPNIGEEMEKYYDISLATKYFLSRAKGQYWVMPEILKGETIRKIFVRVENRLSFTEEEKVNLLHELVHLLRSYGIKEILYDEDCFKIVSGVKKAMVPIVDNKLEMNNLSVRNERLEERFVTFLSKHFDFIALDPSFIDQLIILLVEKIELMEEDNQETLELFLNMLLIKYFYDNDISKCLLPRFANFIEEAKKKYDISVVRKFVDVYQSRYNNKQELKELFSILDTKKIKKDRAL